MNQLKSDSVYRSDFSTINQVFGKSWSTEFITKFNALVFTRNFLRMNCFYYGIFIQYRSVYTKLNVEYKPVNLGQGYSDAAPPPFVRDALIATVTNPNYGLNQYTRGAVSDSDLYYNNKLTQMC